MFDHPDQPIGVIMGVSEPEGLTDKNFSLINRRGCNDRTILEHEDIPKYTTILTCSLFVRL